MGLHALAAQNIGHRVHGPREMRLHGGGRRLLVIVGGAEGGVRQGQAPTVLPLDGAARDGQSRGAACHDAARLEAHQRRHARQELQDAVGDGEINANGGVRRRCVLFQGGESGGVEINGDLARHEPAAKPVEQIAAHRRRHAAGPQAQDRLGGHAPDGEAKLHMRLPGLQEGGLQGPVQTDLRACNLERVDDEFALLHEEARGEAAPFNGERGLPRPLRSKNATRRAGGLDPPGLPDGLRGRDAGRKGDARRAAAPFRAIQQKPTMGRIEAKGALQRIHQGRLVIGVMQIEIPRAEGEGALG